MDEIITQPIPDILTQVSKEKFRRRLLVGSRLLAFLLILSISWFGYSNYKYGDLVSRSPCYACGYYEGKQCDYVYVHDSNSLNETEKEEFLDNLGKYNENSSKRIKELGGNSQQTIDDINNLMKFFNSSNITK